MNITGGMGELTFKVEVKRANTGQVEQYELVGRITQEEAQALGIETGEEPMKESENGSNS